MTETPTVTLRAPQLLSQPSEIIKLLGEAAKGQGVILTRRALRGFAQVNLSEMRDVMREMGRHEDHCSAAASRNILAVQGAQPLGHAPAWVDAGAVYQELVSFLETHGSVEFVFCLDPWAAQLVSRTGEASFGAQWIFVTDLDRRKTQGDREYWEQMEHWFAASPFAAIIPKEVWDEAIGGREEELRTDRNGSIHLQKPGAWQWRKISAPPPEKPRKEAHLLVLVRYSGSVLHLKVFLDSLARQDYPKGSLRAAVLAGEGAEDLAPYLQWFNLAHSELRVSSIITSPAEGARWKAELNQTLKQDTGAVLVLTGDHTVLPDRFARVALEISKTEARPALYGIPLSLEASAHIITGNLDPLPNYENLLKAFTQQGQEESRESARIIPPELWMNGGSDPLSRVLELTQETESQGVTRSGALGLLQLVDLA